MTTQYINPRQLPLYRVEKRMGDIRKHRKGMFMCVCVWWIGEKLSTKILATTDWRLLG